MSLLIKTMTIMKMLKLLNVTLNLNNFDRFNNDDYYINYLTHIFNGCVGILLSLTFLLQHHYIFIITHVFLLLLFLCMHACI